MAADVSAAVSAAVKAASGGVALDVEVVPGAAASVFPAGFNAWRRRLEARVAAPPVLGRANAELQALVARYFGVPARDVDVTAGRTSRRKTLLVRGLAHEEAVRRLAGDLP